MRKNAHESAAAMLEKLAFDMEAWAELLAEEGNQDSRKNNNTMTQKTASAEYGSLDSRSPASGGDSFVSWLLGH